MTHVALAIMAGAAIAYFAAALGTPPAFAFLVPVAASCAWRGRLGDGAAAAAQRWLYAACALALGFSWFLRLYPVLGFETTRAWTLAIGYGLAAPTALFLLLASERPAAHTVVPASAALFVISGFAMTVPMAPYLAVAGAAVFTWLAWDTGRAQPKPIALAVLTAVIAAATAAGIIRVLPWTQGEVEASMTGMFGTPEDEQTRGQARLGELQSLKLSSRVVLRVWTTAPRKLRSRVLTRFDGVAWH